MAMPEQNNPAIGKTAIQKSETAMIRKGSMMMARSRFAPNEVWGVVDTKGNHVAVIGLLQLTIFVLFQTVL